ncbi:MAG TPA: hypothetical protein VLG50_06145, partial [Candidatus Saccharimonadales bacterium]|nr:hypothetical protein [Candidatus Saccharimonadales bacterium]
MNQILLLRLSQQEYIDIFSSVSTLGTILSCDKVSLVFQIQDQRIVIKDAVALCEFDTFCKGLELVLYKHEEQFSFLDSIIVYGDQFENFTCEIRYQNKIFFKNAISSQTLRSWIAQLE